MECGLRFGMSRQHQDQERAAFSVKGAHANARRPLGPNFGRLYEQDPLARPAGTIPKASRRRTPPYEQRDDPAKIRCKGRLRSDKRRRLSFAAASPETMGLSTPAMDLLSGTRYRLGDLYLDVRGGQSIELFTKS